MSSSSMLNVIQVFQILVKDVKRAAEV